MDEDARTIWCGNLSSKCNEEILYELFLQAGPLEKVNIPKDRDGKPKNFGFVTFKHAVSVPYALELLEGTSIYNRSLTIKARQLSTDPPPSSISRNTNLSKLNAVSLFANEVLMGYHMPQVRYNMMPMLLPSSMIPSGIMPYSNKTHGTSYFHGKGDGYSSRNHPYSHDRDNNRDRYSRRDYDHSENKGERRHREREHHRNSGSHRSNSSRSGRNYR
ncbi:RNA-binding protein 7 isoform X2 [Fopius arisanus]|uniref:RBM7_0 protein n=1 Tax=Fopius arisanus TaxID=64838 RepID=A0A0C9RZC8_9HYME|nr:PREDICTED: RNA-binding protein 7 isoform X1 [Fopius arisanus]XP_011299774.1 PREDICTED: RNA-binding protein 7 isoform X2 [Fopius arisanus]